MTWWTGRSVAVTGGSSGIGLAVVTRLVAEGASVTVLARDGLDQVPAGAQAVEVDVRSGEAVRAALGGSYDSLITCAGITKPGYAHLLTDDDYRDQMEINYFGTLHAVRAVVPQMMERRSGSITCISSAAGFLGVFGYAAYVPSKFAVRGLCETLRQELKPHGITVSVVCPPDVNTPMLEAETPLKPKETVALSGNIKPLAATRVVGRLLDGTAKGKAMIIPDAQTTGLWRLAGAAPGLVARIMDRTIARA